MSIEIKDMDLKGRKIPKELMEIIVKRIEAMPSNIKIAVIGAVLGKYDILKEIEANTEVGQELLEMEADYYEDLIRD